MIEIQNVAFHYAETTIFRDLTLQLENKTLILGDNGSGKTTLLKLIARELRPDSGRISWNSKSAYRAMPFLDTSILFDHFTILTHLKWISGDQKKDSSWLDATIDRFQLTPYLNQTPSMLSHGQRRWCAYAVSLSFDADIYLLDEPLNALDSFHRNRLKYLLETMTTPIIIAEHEENRHFWGDAYRKVRLNPRDEFQS